ncbi:Extradiol ring-cleavage dioxygenase, class III enzyme, subunit B [Filobasidium floriforme]|uniref:Extradiol ring-cleavage dioxygenase, class III enzyme, subunit B n=1 Tax=Filobasidium floriforme TaxID=5210 RepID=UPI001E8D9EEB|nr:Extradiol ring-cleavage dioxygenase, class III enzyme, subunit B [Filobasidium floriforme]KAH8083132.1 Extradiol ring-cleavage dioxygenase, class III enzyme, subunit B [Filobasidium floriforme]
MVNETSPTYPVFFFSHGSTAMLQSRTAPAAYWEEVGRQALAQGVERIVIMGAHWETLGETVRVSGNPDPVKQPVAWVDPKLYTEFDLNPDMELAAEVTEMLKDSGFDAAMDPKFEQIHDTFMVLKWMFPGGKSLPHVVVSHNARFDPHFHLKIGAALRPLRQRKTLLIGSGGAVHNLYRNNWQQVIMHRDHLAQERPPEQWAIDFGEAFSDVVTNNTGPALRRGLARLMQHPQYRDAQGTDDHFMAALFAAGAAGDVEDEGHKNYAGAECWELLNMRNSQFQFGDWPHAPHVTPIHTGGQVVHSI